MSVVGRTSRSKFPFGILNVSSKVGSATRTISKLSMKRQASHPLSTVLKPSSQFPASGTSMR